MWRGAAVWVVVATMLPGCALLSRRSAPPVRTGMGPVQTGTASWYGPGFHGNQTSSGEIYNQYDLTAAHQTLPLGTEVAVTNLENGRSVEVRINDRGPFVKGRIIDLSYAAARSLGMIGPGTVPVRVEVLGSNAAELPVPAYSVQVGSFVERANAVRLKATLSERFTDVYIAPLEANAGRYYRVRLGRFERRDDAVRLARAVQPLGLPVIIVEDAPVAR